MKVCEAGGCVMPAKWSPRVNAMAPAHWDVPPRPLKPPICVCSIHKADCTLDTLFTAKARQQLDVEFWRMKLPMIDWRRTTLDWEEIDPRNGELLQFPKNPPKEGATG